MLRTCLFLLSACMTVTAVSAQDTLAWKFRNGETLKFSVQQSMKTHMTIDKKPLKTSMAQMMEMSWKVNKVESDGNAVIGQEIDRVRFSMEGGPFGAGAEFDSADNRVPTNQVVKSMSDVFRKIIGQPFSVTMKPSGKVENVEIPESLLKSLTQSGAGVSNLLTEDTLKQMMGQSSVTLPDGTVTVGQSWETTQNVKLPFGTMSVNSKMTYRGRDSETGFARIAMDPSVTVEPNKDSPIQLQLTKSDGTGVILFDRQNGRIARSDLTLNLQLQIMQFGQTITQDIEQKTVMQLVQ
jgi:Family of unknown function (DUF6263)